MRAVLCAAEVTAVLAVYGCWQAVVPPAAQASLALLAAACATVAAVAAVHIHTQGILYFLSPSLQKYARLLCLCHSVAVSVAVYVSVSLSLSISVSLQSRGACCG